ncbi:MAG: outer membrane protein assembly factor BamB [Legionellaceae bacterium]|nr:outer membrane protein assembly factor BamB [Legionellaceae bacterium]
MQVVRLLVLLGYCIFLQACSQVDDYILGKDNTPKPKELTAIVSKVDVTSVWSRPVGKASKTNTYLKLKPVVRSQVIYTADASGLIQAADLKNGNLLWSKQVDHPVVSGPTIAEGYIIVGTDSSTIVLLKQATGQVVWEAHLSEDALSKSIIVNHQVIAKTIDGNLYAFDLATGKKNWVSKHGAPNLILKASSSPIRMGELILVGFSDGKLDAVDVNTGRVVWQRSIAYATGASDVERLVDIDADPIVRNNIVYLASYQGYVGALGLENGQFIWNKPGSVYKNMAIDSNTLYVTDSQDVLRGFDLNNGQVKWKQISLKAHGLTEPVLMGNRLIVCDKTGYLHVVSTHTGELVGRKKLGSAVNISPVVAGDTVYVMLANGSLQALKITSKI